jgi:phosphoribosylformylglycinamidine cyclo-ligase
MTVCVAPEQADAAQALLRENGEQPVLIGEIRRGTGGVVIYE